MSFYKVPEKFMGSRTSSSSSLDKMVSKDKAVVVSMKKSVSNEDLANSSISESKSIHKNRPETETEKYRDTISRILRLYKFKKLYWGLRKIVPRFQRERIKSFASKNEDVINLASQSVDTLLISSTIVAATLEISAVVVDMCYILNATTAVAEESLLFRKVMLGLHTYKLVKEMFSNM